MFDSILNWENSKSEEGVKPPPLNILLPRLFPKQESNLKTSYHKKNFKKKFILKKRKRSKIQKKSKYKSNTFNSHNNTTYKTYIIGKCKENKIVNHKINHYNLPSKCYNCGKSGHHAFECKERKEDICPKCLQKNHLNDICSYEICVNCRKRGHKAKDCFYNQKNKNFLKKCFKCLNYGHESFECLINPNPIQIKNFAKIPLCAFCGSSNHYICPFDKNEGIFVVQDYYNGNNYTDELNINKNKKEFINRNSSESLLKFFLKEIKKKEKIEVQLGELAEDITKEEIKNINFCCKCGKNHFSEDCGKIQNKIKNISTDKYIFNLKENIIHKKNPLKFEPFERKEYRINHHNIRTDYYDQDDSSGESFNQVFKKK